MTVTLKAPSVRDLPAGSTTLPLWNLMQWIARPFNFLEECRERYGDTFTVRATGFEPLVFLSNPEDIRELFIAKPETFTSGHANELVKPLLGNYSIVLLDGKSHERQRKLLMPPFHGQRMREYGQLICQLTQQVISQWQIGDQFSARQVMQEITLRVMLQAVFGLDRGERYHQLKPLLDSMMSSIAAPLGSSFFFIPALKQDWGDWSPWGHFLHSRQQIDEILYQEIRERRANPDSNREDILSLMLAATDEAGEGMSDEELRDELITLVFAGHDTTTAVFAWAMYWIHHLPHVRAKLLQELASLGQNPDPMAIASLPYLKAVCAETLRIYPVVPITFPRVPQSTLELRGRTFPAGTWLFPCIYLTHHNPKIYPEPKQFLPERFQNRKYSNYEYFPFGGGNRSCIGMAFAQFEIKLVLATVLSHWQLELAQKGDLKPVRQGLILAPQGGAKMQVRAKQSSFTPN